MLARCKLVDPCAVEAMQAGALSASVSTLVFIHGAARYLDMIVTPGVVDTFKARSKTISVMRRMLEDQGEQGSVDGWVGGRRCSSLGDGRVAAEASAPPPLYTPPLPSNSTPLPFPAAPVPPVSLLSRQSFWRWRPPCWSRPRAAPTPAPL